MVDREQEVERHQVWRHRDEGEQLHEAEQGVVGRAHRDQAI